MGDWLDCKANNDREHSTKSCAVLLLALLGSGLLVASLQFAPFVTSLTEDCQWVVSGTGMFLGVASILPAAWLRWHKECRCDYCTVGKYRDNRDACPKCRGGKKRIFGNHDGYRYLLVLIGLLLVCTNGFVGADSLLWIFGYIIMGFGLLHLLSGAIHERLKTNKLMRNQGFQEDVNAAGSNRAAYAVNGAVELAPAPISVNEARQENAGEGPRKRVRDARREQAAEAPRESKARRKKPVGQRMMQKAEPEAIQLSFCNNADRSGPGWGPFEDSCEDFKGGENSPRSSLGTAPVHYDDKTSGVRLRRLLQNIQAEKA